MKQRINNKMKDRTNNFTSSQIHKLVKKGGYDGFLKSGQTYIREKSLEYFLGRSLDTNVYTQAIAWGQLMEFFVYEKLEADYIHTHDRRFHNELDWSGVPAGMAYNLQGWFGRTCRDLIKNKMIKE